MFTIISYFAICYIFNNIIFTATWSISHNVVNPTTQYNILQNYICKMYLVFFFRCKEWLVINGNMGGVRYVECSIIFLQSLTVILPVFPVFNYGAAYYTNVPVYASTVHKIKGQDLEHTTLVFHKNIFSPAIEYVVLSRVLSHE